MHPCLLIDLSAQVPSRFGARHRLGRRCSADSAPRRLSWKWPGCTCRTGGLFSSWIDRLALARQDALVRSLPMASATQVGTHRSPLPVRRRNWTAVALCGQRYMAEYLGESSLASRRYKRLVAESGRVLGSPTRAQVTHIAQALRVRNATSRTGHHGSERTSCLPLSNRLQSRVSYAISPLSPRFLVLQHSKCFKCARVLTTWLLGLRLPVPISVFHRQTASHTGFPSRGSAQSALRRLREWGRSAGSRGRRPAARGVLLAAWLASLPDRLGAHTARFVVVICSMYSRDADLRHCHRSRRSIRFPAARTTRWPRTACARCSKACNDPPNDSVCSTIRPGGHRASRFALPLAREGCPPRGGARALFGSTR